MENVCVMIVRPKARAVARNYLWRGSSFIDGHFIEDIVTENYIKEKQQNRENKMLYIHDDAKYIFLGSSTNLNSKSITLEKALILGNMHWQA